MNLAYTSSFSVNGEALIKKGAVSGNGTIPDDVSVRSISVVSASNVAFSIKGLHDDAGWATVETGIFVIEGLSDASSLYFYIKTNSPVIMNLFVKGEI